MHAWSVVLHARKVDVHERLMNDEAEIVGIAMAGG
jgi:hypothetical protein